jgi:pyridoxamine 5'-phosphate oxidase
MSLESLRREYLGPPLRENEASTDPFEQFAHWFGEARVTEFDPTAMALATATADGRPSARMVLLKGVDARGFVFYTNFESRKGRDLAASGRAALLFYWASVERQVRIEGSVSRIADVEADAYFATRSVESRWGAHASPQSRPIESRDVLERTVEQVKARYADDVPRPPFWGGYRVAPDAFEFWQGQPNRLHDRLAYELSADGAWTRRRLAP